MKHNSWIVVGVALALTGTIVIAKSFMSTAEVVQAEPTMLRLAEHPLVESPAATAERLAAGAPPAVVSAVAEAVVPVVDRVAAVPAVVEPPRPTPPPASEPQTAAQPQPSGWTVLVVNGNTVEEITYAAPDVKATLP